MSTHLPIRTDPTPMRTYRGRNGEEVIEISSDEDDTGRVVQSRPIMLQGRTKRLVRRLEGAIEDLKRVSNLSMVVFDV